MPAMFHGVGEEVGRQMAIFERFIELFEEFKQLCRTAVINASNVAVTPFKKDEHECVPGVGVGVAG